MDLMKAAESGFDGADIDALRAYCDRMGIKYAMNNTADTLRKKLKKALGEYNEVVEETGDENTESSIDPKHAEAMGLTNLNLRSQGKWDGKRRKIVLHRAMDHESTFPQFFAWGRLHCYIPFGIEADIPYPIFNILKDTAGSRLIRRRKTDEDGRIFFQEEWVPTQRFMYTDMGDDPDTMHLPDSMRDMVRRLFKVTDEFAGFSERQYRELCTRLLIDIKRTWEAVDMRAAIIARCQLGSGRVDLSRPEAAGEAA